MLKHKDIPELVIDKENIDTNFNNTEPTFNNKSFEKFKSLKTNKKQTECEDEPNDKFYALQGFGVLN